MTDLYPLSSGGTLHLSDRAVERLNTISPWKDDERHRLTGSVNVDGVALFPDGWVRAYHNYWPSADETITVDLLLAPGEVIAISVAWGEEGPGKYWPAQPPKDERLKRWAAVWGE
ncbi:hypothetical protein [Mycobacteroides abscessus]|uniref:hypothetical protein n=1 Tax=Mycobacteroides abscessus TaxID=36809 RepID=UPI001041E132|nr:hypothetical protein [Mycobacteroides abscessus]